MKRILYSEHAIERMYERRIPDKRIEATILDPDLCEQARHGTLKAVKQFGRKKLCVVYKDRPSTYIVVTTYYD